MPDGLTAALFAIAGGLVGAFIKYLFDRWTNAENSRRVRKLELYSSFIQVFWQHTEDLRKEKSGKYAYELIRLANEIALYGSDDVVRALAPVIGPNNNEMTQTSLMVAMRRDILQERSSDVFESVRVILFERELVSP